ELKNLENMICDLFEVDENRGVAKACLEKAVSAYSLSERESDVLRLIADGRSNTEISEKIHVSVSTVKKHIYNIFNKVGVNSRTQLLNLVYERC
ncbi:response regulator transcription factor, partial [Treponema zioleckii]|uniref:response regulator transcription factor n=1 Tax=Treponema zioleckii TaxID=331680 RepID=UPI00168BE0F2